MFTRNLTSAVVILGTGLAGCTPMTQTVSPQVEVAEATGPVPHVNLTPMAAALACMSAHRTRQDLRLGVSDFVDGTGVMEGGTQNSRAFSQRPDMMMNVALAEAGAHLVNRSSVNVAEWELNKAMEKKLGDGRSSLVDNQKINFRPVKAGVLLGSTHYITGAITELNWNIDSSAAEAGAFGAYAGKRTYRISMAVDVLVTNTQTTEIVHAKSYKKQLVGFETNANFFRFVNRNTAVALASLGTASAAATQALELFEANIDDKQNEPTQTALRWVIELAAYDIMRDMTKAGSECDSLLPVGYDDSAPPAAALESFHQSGQVSALRQSSLAPQSNVSVAAATPTRVDDTPPVAVAAVKEEKVAAPVRPVESAAAMPIPQPTPMPTKIAVVSPSSAAPVSRVSAAAPRAVPAPEKQAVASLDPADWTKPANVPSAPPRVAVATPKDTPPPEKQDAAKQQKASATAGTDQKKTDVAANEPRDGGVKRVIAGSVPPLGAGFSNNKIEYGAFQ